MAACDDHYNDLTSRHTAIDYFSIGTCEVGGDSTSLAANGPSVPIRLLVLADVYGLQGRSASPRRVELCVLLLQGHVSWSATAIISQQAYVLWLA